MNHRSLLQPPRVACLRSAFLPLLAAAFAAVILTAPARAESLSALKKLLSQSLQAGDDNGAIAAIKKLGAANNPGAVNAVMSAGARVEEPGVYDACAKAFSTTNSRAVISRITRYLTSKDRRYAALSAEMLTSVRHDASVRKALIKAFLDLKRYPESDVVQSVVLHWIRKHRSERWALRALIDMRKQLSRRKIQDGRLFHNVVQALWEVTGQEYDDMTDWEKYWDTQAASPAWKPAKAPPQGAPPATTGDKGKTSVARRLPSFFGKEIRSARALFIIDVSGSMDRVDPNQPPDEEEKPDVTGGKGKTTLSGGRRKPSGAGRMFGKPGQRTRIQRVKRQLYKMIERYPEGRTFAILAFSTEVTPIVGTERDKKFYPVVMGPRSRKEALAKILTLDAEGITRTDLAFETAFRFENIDTIYLLSDGQPQRDVKLAEKPRAKRREITNALMQEILDYVEKKNRVEGRRLEIHTLGFPVANLARFLVRLAARNYGEFTAVK